LQHFSLFWGIVQTIPEVLRLIIRVLAQLEAIALFPSLK
jgi:hypothetical protein